MCAKFGLASIWSEVKMATLLRKLKASVPPTVTVESEDSISSYEYSFALVYNGPPLSYSIPEVPAFKIDQIPIAAIAPVSDDFSVPVIQPLGKPHYRKKQRHKLLSPDSSLSPNLDSHASNSDADDVLECKGTLGSPGVDDDRDIREFHSGTTLVPKNSDTTESESDSSSCFGSFEICSFREDEPKVETPRTRHAKRPSAVTFRDPESNDMIEASSQEYFSSQIGSTSIFPVKPHAVRPGKKGTCYRCLKGNRLMSKEVCIVCSAKYCRGCVIRAMGSMPQGRKCVTCIGYGIDEEKRGKLGKCSWLLKQLLSEFVVAQVMLDERSCEVNQIPPELVVVNSQPLDREQLMLLLNCSNPPKQLKPGFYWYDKSIGFWGKVKF